MFCHSPWFICALSAHIHVFMWGVDHGPKDCSSHTRHQQNRDGPGIGLLAVTLEAPLSPISSLARFYQYGGISKSTLPHRNSEGIKSVWSICYTPYVGTAFQTFGFLLSLLLTPHKQLRSHLHLVQTLSQTNLTLKHRWPKQILLTIFINTFKSISY